jgi:mannosyltransferase OCH1-like enzyme
MVVDMSTKAVDPERTPRPFRFGKQSVRQSLAKEICAGPSRPALRTCCKAALLLFALTAVSLMVHSMWVNQHYASLLAGVKHDGPAAGLVASTPGPAAIPKLLHQTHSSKNLIPAKVAENIAKFAGDFERIVYDDAEAEAFLEAHFRPIVASTFRALEMGAHKADLFRYCVLYVRGGVYLDIKTVLVRPLDGIFPPGAVSTVISQHQTQVYNGIIAAPPGQPLFLALIADILRRPTGD